MDTEDSVAVVLELSDLAQMNTLAGWLAAAGQVQVERTPGRPGPGEQGAIDVLTLLASSSVLATAIKVLPDFIRSRRSGFRIEVRIKGEEKTVVLEATNANEGIAQILAKLRDK